MYNLFSSLLTPSEAISCGFLLIVCEENVFYFCRLLHVAFCYLCVEKQGVLLVLRRGFKLPSQVSLLTSPLEAPLRCPPFSRGLEKGLEAPFEN